MSLDMVTAGFDLVKTALDKFFPDADTELKGKLAQAAAEIDHEFQLQLKQIENNVEEAKHPSIFVAGARPAAMWVGVISLLYSGIGVSMLSWIALCLHLPPFPTVDTEAANSILFGLLGLGTMRTVEKVKGVATTKVKK
jgi:hypothetical protein